MTPTQRRLLIAFYVLLYLCCVAAGSFVVFKVVSEAKNHAPTYFACDLDAKSCTETNTPTKYTSFDACCKACECNNPDPSHSTYYACGPKNGPCIKNNTNGTFSNPNTCASTCKTYLRYGDKISFAYNDGYLDMLPDMGPFSLPFLRYSPTKPVSYFKLEHNTKKDGEVVLIGDTIYITYLSTNKSISGTLYVTVVPNKPQDSSTKCYNKNCGFGLSQTPAPNEGAEFVLSTGDTSDDGSPIVTGKKYEILGINGSTVCNNNALSIQKENDGWVQTCTCEQSPCIEKYLKWTIEEYKPSS